MTLSPLTLNVLNFAHPSPTITCFLTTQPVIDALKLSRADTEYFVNQLSLPYDTTTLYATTKRTTAADVAVTGSTTPYEKTADGVLWSVSFLKKYYVQTLADHFRGLGYPVKTNFVSDVEIWMPGISPFRFCDGYKVVRMRVQFGRITKAPELVVAWDGIRSVLKESVSSLMEKGAPDNSMRNALWGTRVYRMTVLPEDAPPHR